MKQILALGLSVGFLCSCATPRIKPWEWNSLSESLQQLAHQGQLTDDIFCKNFKRICDQLKEEREGYGPYLFWGLSENQDPSRPDRPITEPAVLAELFRLASVSPMDPAFHTVHSGMLQSYGTLFSTTLRPEGYARDRWLDHAFEAGLGLAESEYFNPQPEGGTFLSNLTYFAGRIAFRDQPTRLEQLKALEPKVAKKLRKTDYSRFTVATVIETTKGSFENPIEARLDFVTLQPNAAGYSHALVYSVKESEDGAFQLLNVDLIRLDRFRQLSQASSLGSGKTIRPLYGAVILGLKAPRPGTRSLKLAQ